MDWGVYKTLLHDKNLSAESVLENLGYEDLSPIELRRIFLLMSRACFSDPDNYNEHAGEELTDPPIQYSEDKYLKSVDVNLDYVYDAEEVGVRPAVFVGLDNISFERQVVGDLAGKSHDNSTTYYADLSKTHLVIRHITTSPDMSYALADASVGFYLGCVELLRSSLPGLADFRLATISKIQVPDPDRERQYRVDVVFSVAFAFAWTTTREGHRLKEINFRKFEP